MGISLEITSFYCSVLHCFLQDKQPLKFHLYSKHADALLPKYKLICIAFKSLVSKNRVSRRSTKSLQYRAMQLCTSAEAGRLANLRPGSTLVPGELKRTTRANKTLNAKDSQLSASRRVGKEDCTDVRLYGKRWWPGIMY